MTSVVDDEEIVWPVELSQKAADRMEQLVLWRFFIQGHYDSLVVKLLAEKRVQLSNLLSVSQNSSCLSGAMVVPTSSRHLRSSRWSAHLTMRTAVCA